MNTLWVAILIALYRHFSASFPFEPCHFEPATQCDYTIEATRARNLRHKQFAEVRSAPCADFSPWLFLCKFMLLYRARNDKVQRGRTQIPQRKTFLLLNHEENFVQPVDEPLRVDTKENDRCRRKD